MKVMISLCFCESLKSSCVLVTGIAELYTVLRVFCNTLKDNAVQIRMKYVGHILSVTPAVVVLFYK